MSTGAVPSLDQATGFFAVHHHGFFQEDIQTGFHAGFSLTVVIQVGGDDDGGLQLVTVTGEEVVQIRFVRWGGLAGCLEQFCHLGIHLERGFT